MVVVKVKDLLLPYWWCRQNIKILKFLFRRLTDYVRKLYQKVCRTCSTIIFPHSTNQIIEWWRCRCGRRFLNSSLTHFLLRVSNGFLKLHLSFLEKIEGNSKFQKNVPLKVILLSSSGTMTIGKLKGLLYRLFKVDITDQQLYCVDSKVITANFIPFF